MNNLKQPTEAEIQEAENMLNDFHFSGANYVSLFEAKLAMIRFAAEKQSRIDELEYKLTSLLSAQSLQQQPATPEQKGVEQRERKFTNSKAELGLNNNLVPCPFCGGVEREQVFLGRTDPDHFIITCICCSVRMKHDRKDKVIGIWNNRKPLADFN